MRRNAIWLAGAGRNVTGVNSPAARFNKARRMADKAGVTARFVRRTWRYVPEPGSADLAALIFLQVPEPLRTVVLAPPRALRPGRRAAVIAHDLRNLDARRGRPARPDVLFSTPEGVAAALRRAGALRRRSSAPVPTERARRVRLDTLAQAGPPG